MDCIDLDIDNVMMRHATDLILSCFYKQYDKIDYLSEQDKPSDQVAIGMTAILNPLVLLSASFPYLSPIIGWFLQFHFFGRLTKEIMGFIKQQTALNLAARQELARAKKEGIVLDQDNIKLKDGRMFKRNMIDLFIDSFHEGKVSKVEYLNSSYFLYLAATITLSEMLARIVYHLAIRKDVQEKLRTDIMRDGRDSTYLSWCINEVIRIDPPAPTGIARLAEHDFELDGGTKFIPKGTYVQSSAYTIHRLPEYWGEDANEFKPERWEHAHKFHPAQFLGFGLGPRGCPGKEFALHDAKEVISSLLMHYNFDRCDKTVHTDRVKSPYFLFVLRDIPTYVRITRRH